MHLYDETVHKWLAKNSTVSGACSDNSLWRFLFRGLPTDHNIRQYYQYALPSSLCRNPKQVTKPIFSMTSWLGLGQAYQESWRCPIYKQLLSKVDSRQVDCMFGGVTIWHWNLHQGGISIWWHWHSSSLPFHCVPEHLTYQNGPNILWF